MSAGDGVRVMLVDDHALVRAGLRDLLEAEAHLEVVGEADSFEGSIAEAERCRPDVIVMDVQLLDGNGIEAAREIRSRHPENKVVMLTAHRDADAVAAAALAGASAYVLKSVRGQELVRSIRAVAGGANLIDSDAGKLAGMLGRADGQADERLASLSAQERKILDLLPSGMTNRQIAGELQLSEKTVKNYISAILMKLRVTRRAEAAAYVVKRRERSGPGT